MISAWTTAFIAAATVTFLATPPLRHLARKVGLVDKPAARKVHSVPVPYLGGVAIAAGVLTGLMLAQGLRFQVCIVALVAAGLCTLGLLDDRRPLRPGPRLGVQLVAAVVTLAVGLRLEMTGVAFVDVGLTVIWIVGITNATNLLDNMDGLGAGVAAAIAASALLLSAGERPAATLAAAVAGSSLGFLAYNKPPASVYMGDAGSLFLGYLLAVMTMAATTPLASPAAFAVPLMLVAVPIADTTTVALARCRRGLAVTQAGKDHLSHRLVRRGLSPCLAVAVLVGVTLSIGVLGSLAGTERMPLTVALVPGALLMTGLLAAALPAKVYPAPIVGRSAERSSSDKGPGDVGGSDARVA